MCERIYLPVHLSVQLFIWAEFCQIEVALSLSAVQPAVYFGFGVFQKGSHGKPVQDWSVLLCFVQLLLLPQSITQSIPTISLPLIMESPTALLSLQP